MQTVSKPTGKDKAQELRKRIDERIETLAKAVDDVRASADYRLRVARNLFRRFYLETQGELSATVYDYGRTG